MTEIVALATIADSKIGLLNLNVLASLTLDVGGTTISAQDAYTKATAEIDVSR
jgi:hypothetical protein